MHLRIVNTFSQIVMEHAGQRGTLVQSLQNRCVVTLGLLIAPVSISAVNAVTTFTGWFESNRGCTEQCRWFRFSLGTSFTVAPSMSRCGPLPPPFSFPYLNRS